MIHSENNFKINIEFECFFSFQIQFHAEKCDECKHDGTDEDDVYEYISYLKSRPASIEIDAIEMVTRVVQKYDRSVISSYRVTHEKDYL